MLEPREPLLSSLKWMHTTVTYFRGKQGQGNIPEEGSQFCAFGGEGHDKGNNDHGPKSCVRKGPRSHIRKDSHGDHGGWQGQAPSLAPEKFTATENSTSLSDCGPGQSHLLSVIKH